MPNNNITNHILHVLLLDSEELNHGKKIAAANNFEKVYRKIDPRDNIVKTSIFRYIQRIAMNEPYNTAIQTIAAIKIATWEMYKIKTNKDNEYRRILKYLQENYPVE